MTKYLLPALGIIFGGCQTASVPPPTPETPPPPPISAAAPAEPHAPLVVDAGITETVKFRDGAKALREKIEQLGDVVVVFSERNNGDCAAMLAIVRQAARDHGLPVIALYPNAAEIVAFGVGNYPTTILFARGAEKQRWLRRYQTASFLAEFSKQFPR
ncbi:hypothetical protein AGMMS49959_00050 [Planctomycetales bacterium]|nr:hypothetical protein AGMMS49959_00050 [Planctomycetales bacterium]